MGPARRTVVLVILAVTMLSSVVDAQRWRGWWGRTGQTNRQDFLRDPWDGGAYPYPIDWNAYYGRWFTVISNQATLDGIKTDHCITNDYYAQGSNIKVTNYGYSGSFSGPANNDDLAYLTFRDRENRPGELDIFVFGSTRADYFILDLGPKIDGEYQFAIVSDAARRFLFVLARHPSDTLRRYARTIEQKLATFNFTTTKEVPHSITECNYGRRPIESIRNRPSIPSSALLTRFYEVLAQSNTRGLFSCAVSDFRPMSTNPLVYQGVGLASGSVSILNGAARLTDSNTRIIVSTSIGELTFNIVYVRYAGRRSIKHMMFLGSDGSTFVVLSDRPRTRGLENLEAVANYLFGFRPSRVDQSNCGRYYPLSLDARSIRPMTGQYFQVMAKGDGSFDADSVTCGLAEVVGSGSSLRMSMTYTGGPSTGSFNVPSQYLQGQFLSTGSDADFAFKSNMWVIAAGSWRREGYDYLVLADPTVSKVLVIAKDPRDFFRSYSKSVTKLLRSFGVRTREINYLDRRGCA